MKAEAEHHTVKVRHARDEDLAAILAVERDAFGQESEADLVRQLLDDPTARPLISLVAEDGARIVGHILLTRAAVAGQEAAAVAGQDTSAMVLGPLAVAPEAQRRGVGIALVETSLDEAKRLGVRLVFLLGHPEYYPRFGFRPAEEVGFKAPHPVPEEHADAWMVLDLGGDSIGAISGTVIPAEVFRRPEHWRE
jgi:putative acetyltransferase